MADMMNLDGASWSDNYDDIFGDVPDYVRLLVILVDCSGSLEGTLIGSVNSLMEEVLSDMENLSGERRILVITYGDNVTFSNETPQRLDEFGGWKRVHAGGFSNLGEALKMLSKKMENVDWYPKGRKETREIFVLFSDGMATDHYQDGLDLLKKNAVFQRAVRFAVNFSDLMDGEVLENFAGKKEWVLNLKKNDIVKAQKQIIAAISK